MGGVFGCDSGEVRGVVSNCGRNRNIEYEANKDRNRDHSLSSQSGSYQPSAGGYGYPNQAYNQQYGQVYNQGFNPNQQQLNFNQPMLTNQHSGMGSVPAAPYQNTMSPQMQGASMNGASMNGASMNGINGMSGSPLPQGSQGSQGSQGGQGGATNGLQIDPRLSGGISETVPHIMNKEKEEGNNYDSDGSHSDSHASDETELTDNENGQNKASPMSRQSVFEMQQMVAGMKQQNAGVNARGAVGAGAMYGVSSNSGAFTASMMYSQGGRAGISSSYQPNAYNNMNRFGSPHAQAQHQPQ